MTTRLLSSSVKTFFCVTAVAGALGAAACGNASPDASRDEGATAAERALHAVGSPPRRSVTPDGTVTGRYPGYGAPVNQGGPVMAGTIYVRPVFYGTAWQPNYQATMTSFLQQIASSSYWNIVQSSYGAGSSIVVKPAINLTTYSYGKSLGGTWAFPNPGSIVADLVSTQAWPVGTNDLFIVFTADDVLVGDERTGFLCSTFAGFHSAEKVTWTNLIPATFNVNMAYAFVGSPEYCINHPASGGSTADAGAASSEWDSSVNGTVIDEAATVVMHELAEAATDPYPPGTNLGLAAGWSPEVGDICAWVPGPSTKTGGTYSDVGAGEPYASNQVGSAYNGGAKYLVQTLWDVQQNGCALTDPGRSTPSPRRRRAGRGDAVKHPMGSAERMSAEPAARSGRRAAPRTHAPAGRARRLVNAASTRVDPGAASTASDVTTPRAPRITS